MQPFMPFLTEELWQRLPRRPNDSTPSIIIASYPEYDKRFDNAASATAYELVLDCSKGIRSLLSEYNIKEDGKAFVQPLDAKSFNTASAQHSSIKTLAGKGVSSLEILNAPKTTSESPDQPEGCAVFPVSAEAIVYVHVKGRIDIDKEIEKAKGKLQKASEGTTKQEQVLADTEGKTNTAVREQEETKLKDLKAEVRALEEAIKQFDRLKIEA